MPKSTYDTYLADPKTALLAALCDAAGLRVIIALLKLQLKFSPDQPPIPGGQPGGGQWVGDATGDDGTEQSTDPLLQQVFDPGAPKPGGVGGIIAAVTAFFLGLSRRNNDDQTAVLVFNARDYAAIDDPEKPPLYVGMLTRDQTDQACPRHREVQGRTSRIANQVELEGIYRTAQGYGTEVHKRLADEIYGPGGHNNPRDDNFRAEYSILKDRDARYGERNSIRIDVFERLRNGTVCVYDVKTGESTFSGARMGEIASRVGVRFPDTRRIIILETRPR